MNVDCHKYAIVKIQYIFPPPEGRKVGTSKSQNAIYTKYLTMPKLPQPKSHHHITTSPQHHITTLIPHISLCII